MLSFLLFASHSCPKNNNTQASLQRSCLLPNNSPVFHICCKKKIKKIFYLGRQLTELFAKEKKPRKQKQPFYSEFETTQIWQIYWKNIRAQGWAWTCVSVLKTDKFTPNSACPWFAWITESVRKLFWTYIVLGETGNVARYCMKPVQAVFSGGELQNSTAHTIHSYDLESIFSKMHTQKTHFQDYVTQLFC